jgi:hypothetical protein
LRVWEGPRVTPSPIRAGQPRNEPRTQKPHFVGSGESEAETTSRAEQTVCRGHRQRIAGTEERTPGRGERPWVGPGWGSPRSSRRGAWRPTILPVGGALRKESRSPFRPDPTDLPARPPCPAGSSSAVPRSGGSPRLPAGSRCERGAQSPSSAVRGRDPSGSAWSRGRRGPRRTTARDRRSRSVRGRPRAPRHPSPSRALPRTLEAHQCPLRRDSDSRYSSAGDSDCAPQRSVRRSRRRKAVRGRPGSRPDSKSDA